MNRLHIRSRITVVLAGALLGGALISPRVASPVVLKAPPLRHSNAQPELVLKAPPLSAYKDPTGDDITRRA